LGRHNTKETLILSGSAIKSRERQMINEGIHFLKEGLLQNKLLLRIGLQGTKVTCEGKSSVHSLDTVIQYNLSNPTHEGTREICRIVQDVGKLVFFYFKEILWEHKFLSDVTGCSVYLHL
jgi:hypothetical protein